MHVNLASCLSLGMLSKAPQLTSDIRIELTESPFNRFWRKSVRIRPGHAVLVRWKSIRVFSAGYASLFGDQCGSQSTFIYNIHINTLLGTIHVWPQVFDGIRFTTRQLLFELLLLQLLLFQDSPVFHLRSLNHQFFQFFLLLLSEFFVYASGLFRLLRPLLFPLNQSLVEGLQDFALVESSNFLDEAPPSDIVLVLGFVISFEDLAALVFGISLVFPLHGIVYVD